MSCSRNLIKYVVVVFLSAFSFSSAILSSAIAQQQLSDNQTLPSLSQAVLDGNVNRIEFLLNIGANINIADVKGNTPLHYAIMSGKTDIALMLSRNGARSDIRNKQGRTPVDSAVGVGNINVLSVIDPNALSRRLGSPSGATSSGFSSKAVLLTGGALALAGGGIAAAAAAGGGGSGSGSSDSSQGGGGSSPTPVAENFREQSNADAAHQQGFTGRGINVAIIDSGVLLNHANLDDNILTDSANNVVGIDTGDDDNDPSPNSNSGIEDLHGTAVAGYVASERTNQNEFYGIAYDANIIPVKVNDSEELTIDDPQGNPVVISNGGIGFRDVAQGIDYAVNNNADIINISLGGGASSESIRASVLNAVESGALLVAASGNFGGINPLYPARYAGDSDFNTSTQDGVLIAVGSVDNTNTISSFSNRCGVAQDFCLVAKGEGLQFDTSLNIDAGQSISGTSFSAPIVAGAAAVVKQAANDNGTILTNRQIADILLTTATDLGNVGVDSVYGRGLVNIEAALEPIGLSVLSVEGNSGNLIVPLSASIIGNSQAFGDSFSNDFISLTFFDQYQRAYKTNVANVTSVFDNENNIIESFDSFGEELFNKTININSNTSMAFGTNKVDEYDDPTRNVENQNSFRFSSNLSNNSQFTITHNVNAGDSFGLSTINLSQKDVADVKSVTNPYLAMIDNATAIDLNYKLDKKTNIKLTNYSGDVENNSNSQAMGFATEVTHKRKKSIFAIQAGLINESRTLLGSSFEGAFSISENTPTLFSTFSFNYDLGVDTNIFANASYGLSMPNATDNSLLSNLSQITSNAFSLGVVSNNLWYKSDKLGFVLSQPLRVVNGSASLRLPESRDFSGNVFYENYNVSLNPTGTETRSEMFYSTFLKDNISLKSSFTYRNQPNHIKDANDEAIIFFKAGVNF